MQSSCSRRGISLLEMMIAVALLAVLFAAVFASLHQMSRAMSGEIASTVLNQETVRGLERMTEKLRPSRIQNLADAGGPNLEFFLPVDADQDGDTLDANLKIEWGQRGPQGVKLNAVSVIRFVKSSTYSEAAQKYDLNRDGDKSDNFDIGRLEEALYPGATLTGTPTMTRPITPDIVVQMTGNALADLNGDGVSDPLFHDDGGRLRIRLFVTRIDESNPRFQLFETSVALYNR